MLLRDLNKIYIKVSNVTLSNLRLPVNFKMRLRITHAHSADGCPSTSLLSVGDSKLNNIPYKTTNLCFARLT
jgi:hypothetical protein